MNKATLDLLETGYKDAEISESGGQRRIRFLGSAAANALGLSTAQRDTPEATPYWQAIASLKDAGAIETSEGRQQAIIGETYYDITPRGEAMLREAGRIA